MDKIDNIHKIEEPDEFSSLKHTETPLKILILEDLPEVSSLMEELLLTCFDNIQVYKADRMLRGKFLYKKHQPNVILLDLDLPDSSTDNTINSISHFHDAIVIILTSTTDSDIIETAIFNGASDYFLKTDHYQKLVQAIKINIVKVLKNKQIETTIATIKKNIVSTADESVIEMYTDLVQTLNRKVDDNAIQVATALAELRALKQSNQNLINSVGQIRKVVYESNGESIVSKIVAQSVLLVNLSDQFKSFLAETEKSKEKLEKKDSENRQLKYALVIGWLGFMAAILAVILEWAFNFVK